MKTVQTYLFIAVIAAVFLLLLLSGFEVIPFLSDNDDFVILQQANLQLVREQYIVKAVILLNDQVTPSQEIGGLQSVVPAFQQVQLGLLKGNSIYSLPGNPPDNVKNALAATQDDETAIVSSVNRILSQQDTKPDPIQVAIIKQHDQSYTTNMYQVTLLLQQNAEAKKLQLFLIKMTIIILTLFVVILKYVLLTRKVLLDQST